MKKLLIVLVLIAVGYHYYNENTRTVYVSGEISYDEIGFDGNFDEEEFSCDGREHCSQMTSYEEAVFFINNCPNTKMDGDGDGIPCERQFNK